MKKIIFSSLTFFIAISAISLVSCEKSGISKNDVTKQITLNRTGELTESGSAYIVGDNNAWVQLFLESNDYDILDDTFGGLDLDSVILQEYNDSEFVSLRFNFDEGSDEVDRSLVVYILDDNSNITINSAVLEIASTNSLSLYEAINANEFTGEVVMYNIDKSLKYATAVYSEGEFVSYTEHSSIQGLEPGEGDKPIWMACFEQQMSNWAIQMACAVEPGPCILAVMSYCMGLQIYHSV